MDGILAGSRYTPAYEGLLAALTEARLESGLSHAQMAARLGRPRSFIGKYETGERRLDVVETFVIIRALGHEPLAFLAAALPKVPDRLR